MLVCTCPARVLREDHIQILPGGGVVQVDVTGILSRRGDQDPYGLELISIRVLENVPSLLQLQAASRDTDQQLSGELIDNTF